MTLNDWELKRMDLYNLAYAAAIGHHSMLDPHTAALEAINDFERAFPRPVRSFMGEESDCCKVERRAE